MCEVCKVKHGRRSRLKRLSTYDITQLPSRLQGRVLEGDLVCNKCYCNHTSTTKSSEENKDSTSAEGDPIPLPKRKIKLEIPTAQSSSVKCIVCMKSRT